MKMTVAEFAKKQNVSAHVANGLLSYLIEKKFVTKTNQLDIQTKENGKTKRGRPSFIYEIPKTVTLNL